VEIQVYVGSYRRVATSYDVFNTYLTTPSGPCAMTVHYCQIRQPCGQVLWT